VSAALRTVGLPWLGLLLAGAGPVADVPTAPTALTSPTGVSLLPPAGGTSVTKCANCHAVGGWKSVVFPHERTGFPLNGAHDSVACKACHRVDFVKQVPQTCAGCHPDLHKGTLGTRCEGCHDEKSWRSTFTVDAHRKTNFPLTGRHGLLPCESCHPDARQKTFSRTTVACVSCHAGDLARAASLGVNHQNLAICTDCSDCRQCHDVTRFVGARFVQHDACFHINGGPHGSMSCLTCHTQLVPTATLGQCMSGTATLCTACHAHQKTQTDASHVNPPVPGYSYLSARCAPCHRAN
jgi:hypothetical protein